MNRKQGFAVAVALCSALWSCADAHAVYLGLGTQLHTVVNVEGTLRSVHRVYAVFDDSNDYLISVYGDENNPLAMQSLNVSGGPGSNFYDEAGTPSTGWWSYGAVGAWAFDPDPLFIQGNSYANSDISWSTPGPVLAGQAGYGLLGSFANGSSTLGGYGVLVMQLTVNAGHNVNGTVNLAGYITKGANEGIPNGANFVATNQTFTTVVPAPGSLLVLALAGATAPRRVRWRRS